MWRMNPIPDTDLTCISDHLVASYSGMMPAVLARQIPRQQMEIDLVRLCASAGARLLTDRVTGIDHAVRTVQFDDRTPVPFDVLSIGIGSTASRGDVQVEGESLVEVKPMQTFLDRLKIAVEQAAARLTGREMRVCVVGGGVAGVEISTCLPQFLTTLTDCPFVISLLTSGKQILPSVGIAMRRKVSAELRRRSITMRTESKVTQVNQSTITLADETTIEADLVIWVTSAVAASLLSKFNLDLDDRGFIETDATLQATSARNLFAVGDTGTIVGEAIPKAGVYAVRQGPVLWENIQRALDGRPLQNYRPQRSFLKLINLGDGRALGEWKGIAFSGEWAMRWKNRIDSRFMDLFQVNGMSDGKDSMQCRGCGCKLGTTSLDAGLDALGWAGPEDAAIVGGKESRMVASTDFFSSPVDDLYLAGRIAAIHSASDIIASGARPTDALANVVLAEGDPQSQQRALHDFMAGAKREFESLGASIVGGHTIVGPRMEAGFTVLGTTIGLKPIRKGNLNVGDRLFLTKPLGIGVLLAAQMRAQCRAAWYEELVAMMLQPQLGYAQIAHELDIAAGTDCTGFGLAGHLIEMLEASQLSAELCLDKIPILSGAETLIKAGIESTLAPENRRIENKISVNKEDRISPNYQLLFDPQTCGGMLFGVSEESAYRFQHAAVAARLLPPTEIGCVTPNDNGESFLKVIGGLGGASEPSTYAAARD
jgi:selenide,water dikinase